MLKVENLTFGYHNTKVLDNISFQADVGEHLSIVGESGSGKSTLLKLLYGMFDLNEGHISWKEQVILGPKFNLIIGPEYMKYVAQEFDLVPYFTVEETVGKHLSNFYLKEKSKRIEELLEVVELNDYRKTKLKHLSGGQKQRIAIAAALAKAPEIILLDEPFSHIDNFQKYTLRRKLFRYFKLNNITCIVATHDKEDVLGYADSMLVLEQGKLLVKDCPNQIYKHPQYPLVAAFFSEYNSIEGEIVYTHQLKVVSKSNLETTVKASYFKGAQYLIEAESDHGLLLFEHDTSLEKNSLVYLEIVK